MNTTEFLSKQRVSVLVVLGSLVLLLVGVGDYFATREPLEFSVFFLIPVSFFTWFINRRAGLLASVASAAIVLYIGLAAPIHIIHPQAAYWNALIWLGFFLTMTLLVGEMKVLYLHERQLSRADNLTHIANRLAFYEVATTERNRAQRYGQPLTLAYLDLDGFKEVNDTMGHDIGDKLLITVARTMRNSIRQTDTAARVGGDEFALLLPNTNKVAAAKVLRKLLRMLNLCMRYNHWPVTFSMGAVTFVTVPESVHEMIKRADEMMYSAKAHGKNRLEQQEIAA